MFPKPRVMLLLITVDSVMVFSQTLECLLLTDLAGTDHTLLFLRQCPCPFPISPCPQRKVHKYLTQRKILNRVLPFSPSSHFVHFLDKTNSRYSETQSKLKGTDLSSMSGSSFVLLGPGRYRQRVFWTHLENERRFH